MTISTAVPDTSSGCGAPNSPALVIALHGTRDPAGPGCAELLRERVAGSLPGVRVDIGWVDVHEKTLDRTLPSAGPAAVVPAFLSAGHHVRHDIPAAVARTHGLARVTPHVGPDLDAALRDRLVEAGPVGDGVVLASAGSRHEDANREVRATAGRLSALLGRPVEVGFFYARHPGLTEAVERLREAPVTSASPPMLCSPGSISGAPRHSACPSPLRSACTRRSSAPSCAATGPPCRTGRGRPPPRPGPDDVGAAPARLGRWRDRSAPGHGDPPVGGFVDRHVHAALLGPHAPPAEASDDRGLRPPPGRRTETSLGTAPAAPRKDVDDDPQ